MTFTGIPDEDLPNRVRRINEMASAIGHMLAQYGTLVVQTADELRIRDHQAAFKLVQDLEDLRRKIDDVAADVAEIKAQINGGRGEIRERPPNPDI
jgi:hypothetical protein